MNELMSDEAASFRSVRKSTRSPLLSSQSRPKRGKRRKLASASGQQRKPKAAALANRQGPARRLTNTVERGVTNFSHEQRQFRGVCRYFPLRATPAFRF